MTLGWMIHSPSFFLPASALIQVRHSSTVRGFGSGSSISLRPARSGCAAPAVLRMLQTVVSAAHNEGIWVSMCGEMAGDPLYSLLLVGLGFDELSMTPRSFPVH